MGLIIYQSSLRWYLKKNNFSRKLLKQIRAIKANSVRQNLRKQLVPLFQNNINPPLFYHVQFETVSTCNNDCSFCAMNINLKNRKYKETEQKLIEKVGNELENHSFSGKLSLYNNNEPLIDKRLPDIVEFFRKKVPKSHITISTNGKLINIDIVKKLAKAGISSITINNYTDNGKLIPQIDRFAGSFSRSNIKDVYIEIIIRNKNEVIHNRAGTSPNAPILKKSRNWFCVLPFEQININPWGDMTICSNDALYNHKINNILNNNVSIYQAWSSGAFRRIRNHLSDCKRSEVEICSICDYPGILKTGINNSLEIKNNALFWKENPGYSHIL